MYTNQSSFENISDFVSGLTTDVLKTFESDSTNFVSELAKLENNEKIANTDAMLNLKKLNEISPVSSKIWVETVELQDKLNKFIHPRWKTQNFDWWMAIIDEETEILNSKNWKWWKDTESYQKIDSENLIVELIDIFHFLLSLGIETKKTDFMFTTLMTFKHSEPNFNKIIEIVRKELRLHSTIQNFDIYFLNWIKIWSLTGKDLNYVMKYYRIKNALNILRQNYGYKNGTYIKIWDKEGHEDNYYAWKFGNEMELNEDMFNNLYKKLEEYYVTNLI